MNTIEDKIMSELSFQIAQLTFNNTRAQVLYDETKIELELFKSVLESDEELKAKFEEVKGKMVNGNQ